MAKKKEEPSSRLGNILKAATNAHKKEVGSGGSIYDPYLSHVRSMRFPSLGLMDMLGFTGLRDSCTVLIDGAPGSHKSSFGIEMFNWGYQYGIGGAIIDCENKAAVDIAMGTLSETTLWLPGHLIMKSSGTVEDAQMSIQSFVDKCRSMNEGIPREQQIPMMTLLDPLAGVPSRETIKQVLGKQHGHADRGHGGRVEALLWSIWLKVHEQAIMDLPFISVFVNHVKERQKQGTGSISIMEKYNPGGCSQNYATTVAFRCSPGKSFRSEAYGGRNYNEVFIKCSKNSRGPTGKQTMVRKYWQPRKDGSTVFWWDWGRNCADFLAQLKSNHPMNDILTVTAHTKEKYSCKQLGMKEVSPSDIGNAVMSDPNLVKSAIKILQLRELKEFEPLTNEDHKAMQEAAHEAHLAYLADAGMTLEDEEVPVLVGEDTVVEEDPEINLGDGDFDDGTGL